MRSLTLALGLILATIHGGEASHNNTQYMLLVPSVLKAGNVQTFCIKISHLNESLMVTVDLEANKNMTLLERQVTQREEFNCYAFQVPDEKDSAHVAFINFEAVGDSIHFRTRRSVVIRPLYNLVFLQTDKPIYKPGQKVQFRAVSLDENFRPVQETFPVIYVQDPEGNRISQWLNVETKRGITQESFLLTSEPRQGMYTLVAQRKKGSRVEHTFTVEEYVLPKYEVQVKMPPVITIQDEAVNVSVCGKYTYGRPVAGNIQVRVCRRFSYSYSNCPEDESSVCESLSHEADNQGCFSATVNTKIFQLRRNGYEMKLTAVATIKEEGTDVELTGEGSTQIKTTIARASFRHLDSQFKRGIPLHGQIFLEDAAGKPIPNEIVTLYIGYDGKNYTTGSDGTADFTICTSSLNESSILLRASYKTRQHCYSQRSVFPTYEEDSRTVSRYYSRSNSFLKIQPIYQPLECQTEMSMTVHYKLSAEGVKDMSHAVFHYLIMSKAAIKRYGTQKIYMDGQESDGQFTFNFYTGFNLSPLANVLVYMVLDSGEVIADSAKFKVKNCFANEAKVTFTDNEVLPGSNVDLVLTSHPNSMCALRAVDKSVLLLKPEAELSAKTVYDLLPLTDLSGYMHEGFFLEEMREDPCIKLDPIFMNGVYYVPSAPKWDSDVYSILKIFGSWNITAHVSTGQPIVVLDSQLGNKIKAFGLKVGTNTNIRVPRLCAGSHPVYFAPGVSVAGRLATDYIEPIAMMSSMEVDRAVSSVQEAIIETARTFFPETWLWDLVVIDAPGESVMKLIVPDSITTWKVGMFCTSEEAGFGLAETVSLLTFQHFFLDLTLPYSAVRGEEFTLKATVFNYMKQSIRMKVTLEDSDQFTVKKRSVEHDTYCVEANGRVTVTWEVVLKSLYKVNFTVSAETVSDGDPCGNEIVSPAQGRKDIITKHIIVHPEGIPKEETHTAMICNKDSTTTETIALVLPSLTVEGSARAVFSVIGDIMGTAMQNLGNLLKMPYGCGEQNMGLFTPNILILDYLNNTKQLTPEIQSKALNFLSTGYQRQLNYKHSDGSYSAFGPHYGQGNTWLTAFVLRSFYRAKSHIYIDPRQISDPLTWLSLRQKENGCFQSVGYMFNNAMTGGVANEITLSTYIAITLLEINLPVTHTVVRNALFCLESALEGNNNIYTKALMAYAFSLAGKWDIRSRILQSLDEKAVKHGNTVHWQRPEFSEEQLQNKRAPSLEVEMTSYVLLAELTKPELTDEDLTQATKKVYWILKQQNPNGGFSSTPDTVVALQALATYGYHAFKHDGPRDVAVSHGETPVAKLHVEDSNRLLLQQVPLPNIPGDYSVSVSGSGCVFMQSTLRYNIPHPKREAPFTITVTTLPSTCTAKSLHTFSISVNVSYTGNRENSNMAIVEVKLPSGYIPIKPSVRQLTSLPLIKRTESQPNKVIVYFEKLTSAPQVFKFNVEQEIAMSNLKAASAKIYDYYESDDYAVAEYSAPCSSRDDVHNE